MSRALKRAKPKAKVRTAPIRRGKTAAKRRPGPRKATNWLHARARDVRRGHNVRGTVLSLLGGFFAVVLFALWVTGGLGSAAKATQDIMASSLMAAGFRIEYIEVVGPEGRSLNAIDKSAVRQALAVEEGELVFAINLNQARRRIEDLGWIKEARIMRQLPNRLTVIVIERAPYALWQSGGKWHVISENGKVLVSADAANYPDLPLVVGTGGAAAFKPFLATMQAYPYVLSRVQFFVRVSDRRWNLRLQNGADLMLPTQNPAQALTLFEQVPEARHLLDFALKRIDARLSGQIFVRPMINQNPITGKIPERMS